ncbi:hypothetical protein FLAG1_08861 [Fusarium langsethiae]|uniref:Uncharacterized protein n=1 Tax=Fusarium langsethiae TaxID=179993 RepID=A0A0M9ES14_FUSLA|nr:hypothetical protein FLAG1_08861 [Fusarium langsethiae]GKU07092.1 unnamed protein product [Fusarium langsethiae]
MATYKLTPALMTGSLLLGLVLALGHHFYYHHLDGRIVQSQNQQQWFLRLGTGLAFLVRAFLSAAVGIAYTQILWRTLRSKSVSVGGVNSLFGVVHNAWDFVTLELWTAAPALAVVAIIAWALPLVAVITPATLTVKVSPEPNITVLDAPIPIPDYSTLETFGKWTGINGGVSLGSILTLPAPFPNSSYALDFYGPTLSCDVPKNKTFSKEVGEIIANSTWSADPYAFVGFVPSARGSSFITNGSDEAYGLNGLEVALNSSLVATAANLDQTGGNTSAAKFYVAVPNDLSSRANKSIECQLYNSSFALNFTFNNGQQNVRYKSNKINPVSSFDTKICRDMDLDYCRATHAYISIMATVGQFLLGSLAKSHYGSLFSTQTQIRSSILMDTKEMQTLNEDTPESMIGNISMSDALEDLFTNVTISLFSNQRFIQNNTVASRGPITYSSAQNAFSYEPRNLFIAYGIGLLLSSAIVIIGLLCIKSASASYESCFSTILRTTRNPDLDTIVPAAETTGAEPLSKHLSNVRLVLRRQEGGPERSDGEGVTFFATESKSDDRKREQTNSPAESLLQRDKAVVQTHTNVEESTVGNNNASPWERNEGRNLEMSEYRQDVIYVQGLQA